MFVFFFPEQYFHLPTVRVSASPSEEEGIMFFCFVKDFSPKNYKIKWLKNDKEVTSKISESNTPLKEERKTVNGTLYSVASFLTVESTEWVSNTNFTCQFEGRGEDKLPVYKSASAVYEERIGKSYSFNKKVFF